MLEITGRVAMERGPGFRGWLPSEIVGGLIDGGPRDWLVLRDVVPDVDVLASLVGALEVALCRGVAVVLAGEIKPAVLLAVAGAISPRPLLVLDDAMMPATSDELSLEAALLGARGVDCSLGIPRGAGELLAVGLVDGIVSERCLQSCFF